MTRIFIILLFIFLSPTSFSDTSQEYWTLQKQSVEGLFELNLSCKKESRIGEFIPCSLKVLNNKQEHLGDSLSIIIGGGMPLHTHGLPTEPVVSWSKVDEKFLIQGFKLSMSGEWLLHFYITDENTEAKDVVTFKLHF